MKTAWTRSGWKASPSGKPCASWTSGSSASSSCASTRARPRWRWPRKSASPRPRFPAWKKPPSSGCASSCDGAAAMDGSAFTRDKHWGSVAAAAVILLGLVGAVAAAAAWARQPATAEAVRPLYRLHVIPHSDDAFHQEAKPVAQKALLDYLTRHGPG